MRTLARAATNSLIALAVVLALAVAAVAAIGIASTQSPTGSRPSRRCRPDRRWP